jgi:hypothetical protein
MIIIQQVRHGRQDNHATKHVRCTKTRKAGQSISRPSKGQCSASCMMMMILHQVRHGRQDNHATNHVRCAETSRSKQSRRHIEATRPDIARPYTIYLLVTLISHPCSIVFTSLRLDMHIIRRIIKKQGSMFSSKTLDTVLADDRIAPGSKGMAAQPPFGQIIV